MPIRPALARCACLRTPAVRARTYATWSSVVEQATSALRNGAPGAPADDESVAAYQRDPLAVVGEELSTMRSTVSSLLGSGTQSLDRIAKYYFQAEGKNVRPMIVLLIAKATNGLSPAWAAQRKAGLGSDANIPISPAGVLQDVNPDAPPAAHIDTAVSSSGQLSHTILPTQRRLAEITEMIHVASLLHDDVIDASPLRRGAPSAPSVFGNKLSILGGDFLLGRASIALARLRDAEVTELMSTVIANLVEGEVMQMKTEATHVPVTDVASTEPTEETLSRFWTEPGQAFVHSERTPALPLFRQYLQKTYLKTASLIAKSARSAAVLGGCSEHAALSHGLGSAAAAEAAELCDAVYQFGRNVGVAFQLVDDLLDFRSTSEAFGKPSGGADLQLGLATAPVLFAWQEMPDSGIYDLVKRRFGEPGDVQKAMDIIHKSSGLERTAALARHHASEAAAALNRLPPSDARAALLRLNEQIITRVK
ncbi:tRNA dimethylallyltransferase [Malassezia cuniculi]|uniref:(2E,6E)-farnesyl diphosphate synthase n=1 Tax=Malassezia cuniculi TaxID=948313 RepID=A0AAF0J7P1_9BASI|nr:tRNA dimethylallyltransferase [Malassezia cuniculi]